MKRTNASDWAAVAAVAFGLLSACNRHELRVEPQHAKVRLDQSVVFTAAKVGKEVPPKTGHGVAWKARNLSLHEVARVPTDGIFTAKLPGEYKIIAESGEYNGYTTARVLEGVTKDPNEKPWKTTPVSSRSDLGSAPPLLPQPPVTGPGWRDDNFRSAFLIENRRGRDASRRTHGKRSLNLDSGTGNGNYLLSIPLLSLPGRGLNLSLNLAYNSQLWTVGSGQMLFDHGHGFPAAGWALDFGRMVQSGSAGGTLEDADGTPHPFAASVSSYGDYTSVDAHTTDGTLIDYHVEFYNSHFYAGLNDGWAK